MTDNASEAAKMIPRVTVLAGGGWFDVGGPLVPFFFFGDAFVREVGLGWRCRSSESDITGRRGGWVVVGLACAPGRSLYILTSVPSNASANSDPKTGRFSLGEGKKVRVTVKRWYFLEGLHTKTFVLFDLRIMY